MFRWVVGEVLRSPNSRAARAGSMVFCVPRARLSPAMTVGGFDVRSYDGWIRTAFAYRPTTGQKD
jgi:hypothetical protein